MVNILVVDDEPMICKGVATILKQSKLDINEVFIAYNGYEALDFIHLEKIDLVFTDIQMEKMNGIELIENIFLEDPSIPIVILSAHGEFEYAQKAIRFGAKEYLVKPITPPHLISVVTKLLKEKEEKGQRFANWEGSRTLPGHMTHETNYFLNELMTGTIHESEVPGIRETLEDRMNGTYFSMLTVKLSLERGGIHDQEISTLKDRNLLKYAALNIMEETASQWSHLVFNNHNSIFTLLLQITEEESRGSMRVNQLLMVAQMIHTNLQKYLNVKSQIGISRIREGITQWPVIYKEALESLTCCETNKGHYMFYIEDKDSINPNPDFTRAAVDEANNRIVYETKVYIEGHFCDKGLKLQDIADAVHLSPNYLSYLFKKVMGTNIWDYVTKLRMEEGKRLILTTDKRRYEISEEIGYESPEHFSKIFKKHFGINISEVKQTGT
ncbi:response regulator [Paenibacillus qinlingensis]|uniref:YesN/AraC family two-component response regulator n=1 Tax=Paenibacillus qinlingensis TaxID=1837343 RepID=A0ABU1NV70_9BACL|nr:response regulator [Paenibacillus qinlingensis]MDR6551224.1 YesN/AraC family two-component response regulator [Paenibacillus qinlingensis]